MQSYILYFIILKPVLPKQQLPIKITILQSQ